MFSTIIKSLLIFCLVGVQAVSGQVHDPRAIEADPFQQSERIAPTLKGLGDYQIEVTTQSSESQYFFNQGLRLTYGFNHSEALRAFKEAIRLDPANAMAYWGWALVLGPNLNLPMVPDVRDQAYQAIQSAVELKSLVSTREQDFIDALATRYAAADTDRVTLDQSYADAMGVLQKRYPDDPDAATLYAAALMNLNPWNYWYRDGRARTNTGTILAVLESVIERNPDHPGALHYYIHAVESRHPAKAADSADRLRGLMPGAGHLVHMPSHIYMRIGRYADAFEANRRAVIADEGYIAQCRAQGLYPLNYYPHNIHFLAWAALFQGRSLEALAASRKVAEKILGALSGNTWGLYETFISQPLYTMVRFGMWDAILDEPAPEKDHRYVTGVWHYARGLAHLNLDNAEAALQELALLQSLMVETEIQDYFAGFAPALVLLTIGEQVLLGEIAAGQQQYPRALAYLERAVRLEDSLTYNEPPDWYYPVRHTLGAVLLESGLPREAAVVYWEDLRRNPDNGFALFGLAQSLRAQENDAAAEEAEARFRQAWSMADVQLESSRF